MPTQQSAKKQKWKEKRSRDRLVQAGEESALRKSFNETGGFLDPMLARVIREKAHDKSGPKPRTDVKRYGMPVIVNTPKEAVTMNSRAVQAEKTLKIMLTRRRMQRLAAKTKLREMWGWSKQLAKDEAATKVETGQVPTAPSPDNYYSVHAINIKPTSIKKGQHVSR